MTRLVVLLAVCVGFGPVSAQDTGDRSLVLAAVQTFMDVIGNRDVEAAKRVMLPEGRLISNPEVRIHGTIATVSTPYDFHRDGKFTHCGTDVFSLVKTAEGWKIAGAMWTIQRVGCAPSPLGPPK